MRRYQPPAPKPFNFVRLQRPVRKKLGANQHWQHDRYTTDKDFFTGRMTCEIEALTHIHIGSGTFELLDGEVIKGFVHSNGRLIVPGSSLKGVVRSVAEAISKSCICKIGRAGKDLMPRYKNWRERFGECSPPRASQERKVRAEDYDLCIACSIFGGMGYQGRVHFEDAVPLDFQTGQYAIPSLFSPGRDRRLRKYRDDYGSSRGRKFYYHGKMAEGREPYEVIKERAKFDLEMGFENLNVHELTLVLASMGVVGNNPLMLKIGGGKSACMGSISIAPVKMLLQKSQKDAWLNYDTPFIIYGDQSVEDKDKDMDEILQTLTESLANEKALVQQFELRELQKIWRYPSDKECPDRNY